MTHDLQQDIFLKRPVSEKPGEDKCYIVEANGTHQEYLFADGEWHSPKMGGGEPESWLQPMKLVDVLGSLKVPRFIKATKRKPEKDGNYHVIVTNREKSYKMIGIGKVRGGEFTTIMLQTFTTLSEENNGYDDENIEWLDDSVNLSSLLLKVAEESWQKCHDAVSKNLSIGGPADFNTKGYEDDKAQYLSQFRGK